MLASFFYQGDVPTSEALLDTARECLVAAELNGDLDPEACHRLLRGLHDAYAGALAHESEDYADEPAPPTLDKREAEALYQKTAARHYVATVKRKHPDYTGTAEQVIEDGVFWWPDAMEYRDGYCRPFIAGLAQTAGELEGERALRMYRAYQLLPKGGSHEGPTGGQA